MREGMGMYAHIFRTLWRSVPANVSFALTVVYLAAGQYLIYSREQGRLAAGETTLAAVVAVAAAMAFLPLFAQFLAIMEIRRYIKYARNGVGKEPKLYFFHFPVSWFVMAASLFFEPPNPRWPFIFLFFGCGMLAFLLSAICLLLYGLTYTGYKKEHARRDRKRDGLYIS